MPHAFVFGPAESASHWGEAFCRGAFAGDGVRTGRDLGKVCWRREFSSYGGPTVEIAGNLLLARTAQTLYALDPESGDVRWTFCPQGLEGETLYSDPVVDGRHILIGDRRGWLYCLDVETGETIWKQLTSDGPNSRVNTKGVVVGGLVIIASNPGLALAYSAEDGRPVWQCELDGPCTNHLFPVEDRVVAAAESLYFLTPATGELQGRVQWPDLGVAFATGTPSQSRRSSPAVIGQMGVGGLH